MVGLSAKQLRPVNIVPSQPLSTSIDPYKFIKHYEPGSIIIFFHEALANTKSPRVATGAGHPGCGGAAAVQDSGGWGLWWVLDGS